MDEKELIYKSLQGEEQAFNFLIQEHQAAVFRHCLNIVKDEEIAQDLTQETFLQAFNNLASFQMKSRFSTWLWRIAHNISLNYLKKNRRFEKEFKEEFLLKKPTIKNEIDEDLLAKVQETMQYLPIKQRVVFEMYDLKHIRQKEIAAILGIKLGTVRSRLYYARKKIRQFLEGV